MLRTFSVLALNYLFVCSHGFEFSHKSSSSSQYIHSNDTFSMTLSSRQANALYGPPESVHTLEFVLTNNYKGGHFMFQQASEDHFLGIMDTPAIYLERGQQQTIKVTNMRVPTRPDGEKVRYTITAIRDSEYSFRKKRETSDEPVEEVKEKMEDHSHHQAQDTRGGNGGVYLGGSGNVGGSGGQFSVGGGGGIIDTVLNAAMNTNDPSFRKELSITVEFLVTTQVFEDNDSPDIEVEFYEEEGEEGNCMYEKDDLENCHRDVWWTKFTVQDEESGLHLIDFVPTGGAANSQDIYYRYENFALGTNREVIITAHASCCLEGIMLKVTDAMGNVEEQVAENGGGGMSDGLKYALIAIGCLVGLIIIGVVVYYTCGKKQYSGVSQG